jgi:hypothetical protein
MKLTDKECINAKPKTHTHKLADGQGLYLQIEPNGSKFWRYGYRYMKKQKTLALGVYPDVSLKEAREKHQEARKKLKDGKDPATEKKLEKLHADRLVTALISIIYKSKIIRNKFTISEFSLTDIADSATVKMYSGREQSPKSGRSTFRSRGWFSTLPSLGQVSAASDDPRSDVQRTDERHASTRG